MNRHPTTRLVWRAQGRFLWRHRLLSGLLVLGVALGVAVIHATDLANASARHSLQQVRGLLGAGADARIQGVAGVSAADYAALRRDWLSRWPGLQLQPRIEGRLWQKERHWQLLGIDPLGSALLGELRQAEATDAAVDTLIGRRAVLLSSADAHRLGLARGDTLELDAAGGRVALRVAGVLEGRHAELLRGWLIADIGTAQALLGADASYLSHLQVSLPDPALAQTLSARLPPGLHWSEIGDSGDQALLDAVQFNLSALSLLALAVGAFLVISMADDLFCQRRGLMRQLWLAGVPASQLRRMLLLESLLLGAAGLLLGWLIGGWLGRALLPLSATGLGGAGPVLMPPGPLSWIKTAALALGLTAACTAVLLRHWPQADDAPDVSAAATRSSLALRRGLAAAGLLASLLLVLLPSGLFGAFAAMAMLALASLLCLPECLRLLAGLGRCLAGRRAPLLRIALADVARAPPRLCLAVAALVLALAASLSVALMVGSLRDALGGWLERQLQADLYLYPQAWQDGDAIADTLLYTGVASASSRSLQLQLDTAHGRLPVQGLDPGPESVARLAILRCVKHCLQRWRAGDALASEPLARRLGLTPGQTLTLPSEAGPVQVTIAGIMRDYNTDGGRLLLHRERVEQHWPGRPAAAIGLHLHPGDDATAMAAHLRGEGWRVTETATLREVIDTLFEQTFAITEWLRLLVLLIALAAVVGSLLVQQQMQQRQLATLRALGASRRGGQAWFAAQALSIALVAGLLAIPLGYALGWLLVDVVNPRAFGWSMPLHWQPGPTLTTPPLALAAGFLALLLPVWLDRRRPLAEGLYRE